MVTRKNPDQPEPDPGVGFTATAGSPTLSARVLEQLLDHVRSERPSGEDEVVRMAVRVLSLSQAHDPRKRRRILGPASTEGGRDVPLASRALTVDPMDRMVAEVAEVTRMSEADVARVIAAWQTVSAAG